MKRIVLAVGVVLAVGACTSHSTPTLAQRGYAKVGTYQGVTFWQRNFSGITTTGRFGSICNGGGPRGFSHVAVCNDWTRDGGVIAAFVPSNATAARAGDVGLHIIRTSGAFSLAVAIFAAGIDPATLPLGPVRTR